MKLLPEAKIPWHHFVSSGGKTCGRGMAQFGTLSANKQTKEAKPVLHSHNHNAFVHKSFAQLRIAIGPCRTRLKAAAMDDKHDGVQLVPWDCAAVVVVG